jgi:hypothetical protein
LRRHGAGKNDFYRQPPDAPDVKDDYCLVVGCDLNASKTEENTMEKRIHPRIPLRNLSVDASDGFGFSQGRIADVSRLGLCMTDLPDSLNGQVNKMIAIIRGQGKNFKMTVRPKWSTTDGASQSVGVEIVNPSGDWMEFIRRFEPKTAGNPGTGTGH